MSKFEESNFYKALQDFFINADKKTFLQFLAEFYNRTEGIIDKNNIQDDLIKDLRELYLEFNEKGIDENIVREKVNYFLENSLKIKDIISKLTTNTNKIEDINSKLNTNTNKIEDVNTKLNANTNKIEDVNTKLNANTNNIENITSQLEHKANKMQTETDIKTLYSLKSEKSTTDSLQSQINNLVLNSGGDSNLEVVQSRTNSVGSIFYNSKNHIDNIEKAIFNKIDRKYRYKWAIGTTNAETGGTATNNTRITTDNIVYADNDLTISMSDYSNYKFGIRLYPNYPDLTGSTDPGWILKDTVIPQGSYFRLNLSKVDGTAHNMTDPMTGELFDALSILDNKTIEHFLKYDISQIDKDIKKNKEDIENIKKNGIGVVNEKNANVLGIAHRGYSLECPENTMVAYEKAYEKGFRILETDIKITSDNVLVLLHDNTINSVARNIDGSELTETINISNITYNQATQYDYGLYKGSEFKGTKLATLEDLLLFAKKKNCIVYIDGFASNIINKIYLLVNKLGMTRNVIWSSFVKSDLEHILTLNKKAHVVYLYSGSTIENSIIDDVSTLKTDFNEVSFATYYPNVTDLGLIEYAHYKGIRFGIYSVNNNSEIIRFVNAGVDEITTDGLNVAEILLNNLK